MKNRLVEYDFSKPIKLLDRKRNGFDIYFYSACLSLLIVAILALICVHDGQFRIEFVLWRVLVCIPLIILAYIFKQLLKELKDYPKKLMAKHTWTIEELMAMTGKNREETENIMTHVFESCFIVDNKNIKK